MDECPPARGPAAGSVRELPSCRPKGKNIMQRHLALVLAVSLGMSSMASAAELDRLGQLVRQLGSDRFAERDAASRELNELGAEALDALKAACDSEDMEVRHRASLIR